MSTPDHAIHVDANWHQPFSQAPLQISHMHHGIGPLILDHQQDCVWCKRSKPCSKTELKVSAKPKNAADPNLIELY